MPLPHSDVAVLATQFAASIFFSILFLQSGMDKVTDFNGNLEWLKGHFAKSFLSPVVPILLATLTVMELAAGALSAVGCVFLIAGYGPLLAAYGAAASTLSLLALFFGQRMAKDYAGAATLVPHFIVALINLYLTHL
jgi:uncharacterized membrane protein YphA (DoxX/SURF4 family)